MSDEPADSSSDLNGDVIQVEPGENKYLSQARACEWAAVSLCALPMFGALSKEFWYVVGQIMIRESGSRQSYGGNRN